VINSKYIIYVAQCPNWALTTSSGVSRSHTIRFTTCRTPPNEWSAHRRPPLPVQHTTSKTRTCMLSQCTTL